MPTSDLSYNLMDRPWIPVTMTDGSFQCLSIVEVLERADRIRSIDGDIPLQRFALVRLLLAIIHHTHWRRSCHDERCGGGPMAGDLAGV